MNTSKENNYAFIDSQNLNLGIHDLGWNLDFKKFRVYLQEKYSVNKAYLFIGYMSQYEIVYENLRKGGYRIIFKPTVMDKIGNVKGNCDAELVLHAAAIEYYSYDRAVVVTGDGDFYCLAKYLHEKGKLKAILVPNRFKFSSLLKARFLRQYLRFMNDLTKRLSYKEKKAP